MYNLCEMLKRRDPTSPYRPRYSHSRMENRPVVIIAPKNSYETVRRNTQCNQSLTVQNGPREEDRGDR